MEVKKNNKLTNILNDLFSENEKKNFGAIKQIRKHGKKEVILPLVKKLASTENIEIKNEITGLLFDLKDQSTVDELITCIQNDKYRTEKPLLISVFWQSSLDGSQHISTFVNEAINGDYMVALEVLSVIDNFDATFQEGEIEDLRYDLNEAIDSEQSEKLEFLKSIKAAIDSLNLEF